MAFTRQNSWHSRPASWSRDAFMLRQVLQIESWIRSASQARSNPVEYSYWEEKRRHSKNTGIELIFLAQPQDAPVSGTDFQMFYCFILFACFLVFPGAESLDCVNSNFKVIGSIERVIYFLCFFHTLTLPLIAPLLFPEIQSKQLNAVVLKLK